MKKKLKKSSADEPTKKKKRRVEEPEDDDDDDAEDEEEEDEEEDDEEEEEEEAEDDEDEEEEAPKKKKSKASSSGSDRMAALRKEYAKSGDGEDEESDFFKWKPGKNVVRILPSKEEGQPFYEEWFTHYNVGPDGDQSVRCIEPGGAIGKSKSDSKKRKVAKVCPICKVFVKMRARSNKFEFGSKEGKKAWKEAMEWRGKHSFVISIVEPKGDDPLKVHAVRVGVSILMPLLDRYYDEEAGGDFTDPETGRNITVVMTKRGKDAWNVDYEVIPAGQQTPLKGWKKIRKNLIDLTELLPEELSAKQIQEIMDGDGDADDDDDVKIPKRRKPSRDDDDEGDLDDGDDDDDGEKPAPRVKKSKRRAEEDVPDIDADEEDDDDEEEEEEEEDDEEEEERPKKKGLKSKLAKKARRE